MFTIGPAVWHLPNIFEFVTPKPPFKCPLGLEVLICLANFHSVMHLYTCAKVALDRSRDLEAFPDLLIDYTPPLTPHAPRVSRG